jgi:VanZ family protein
MIYRLHERLGGDIFTYFFMGVTFVGAGYLMALPRSLRSAISVTAVAWILLRLEEFSQIWVPTREFSWLELGIGLTVALLTILILATGSWLLSRS